MLQASENGNIAQNDLEDSFTEQTVNAFRERYMKEFMDLLLLSNIEESGETSGYDFLKYLHRIYDIMISPGTVYSVAYSMQRDGLIKAKGVGRKTVFSLTPKGKMVIDTIRNSNKLLQFGFAELMNSKPNQCRSETEISTAASSVGNNAKKSSRKGVLA